jgi:hypothetical protein
MSARPSAFPRPLAASAPIDGVDMPRGRGPGAAVAEGTGAGAERSTWRLDPVVVSGPPCGHGSETERHEIEVEDVRPACELNTSTALPVLAIVFEPEERPSGKFHVLRRGERPPIARCRTLSEAEAAVTRRIG